jgi:hypothetical protein
MKPGYTLAELEQIDQEQGARRSFFQKSRRLERALRREKYWPLYKKLRRLAELELERMDVPAADDLVDRLVETNLADLAKELKRLFADDQKSRAARATIALGGAVQTSAHHREGLAG